MSLKSETYNRIIADYEALQTENSAKLKARYNNLCEKLPRVAEIDKEIEALGIKSMRETILNPKAAKDIVHVLNEKIDTLNAEKEALIKASGLEGYLEIDYKCPLCKDTGYIGSEKCSCLKNRILEANYDMSSIRDILKYENFGTFNADFFSDEVDSEYGISPKTNALHNLEKAMDFCSSFPSGKNLIFLGLPGLGKTFLCNCIAKEILDKGKTVIYITSWQLFKKISDATFRCDGDDEAYDDMLEDIMTCDLLIIDDLGTELVNSFSSSELFNIINQRLNSSLSVILSTNLSIEDLTERYSERIVSRILGSYDVLKFFGDDIRIIKKFMQ